MGGRERGQANREGSQARREVAADTRRGAEETHKTAGGDLGQRILGREPEDGLSIAARVGDP